MKYIGTIGAALVLPTAVLITATCILDAALPHGTWPALNKALAVIPDPIKAGAIVLTALCAYLVTTAATVAIFHALWGEMPMVVDVALFLAAVAWPLVGLFTVVVVIPALTLWTMAVWACKAGARLSGMAPIHS